MLPPVPIGNDDALAIPSCCAALGLRPPGHKQGSGCKRPSSLRLIPIDPERLQFEHGDPSNGRAGLPGAEELLNHLPGQFSGHEAAARQVNRFSAEVMSVSGDRPADQRTNGNREAPPGTSKDGACCALNRRAPLWNHGRSRGDWPSPSWHSIPAGIRRSPCAAPRESERFLRHPECGRSISIQCPWAASPSINRSPVAIAWSGPGNTHCRQAAPQAPNKTAPEHRIALTPLNLAGTTLPGPARKIAAACRRGADAGALAAPAARRNIRC
jgi:hypothetical protein